jgi:hypothetical protein
MDNLVPNIGVLEQGTGNEMKPLSKTAKTNLMNRFFFVETGFIVWKNFISDWYSTTITAFSRSNRMSTQLNVVWFNSVRGNIQHRSFRLLYE